MLDPITNAISAGRTPAVRRDRRAGQPVRGAPGPGRDEHPDRFDAALGEVEAAPGTRPLADAVQEEALEDRAESAPDAPRPARAGGRLDLTA